jgi:hypothetical protein
MIYLKKQNILYILVKLLTRSQKIAFNLLHKIHLHGNSGSNSRENLLKPGDRVGQSIVLSILFFDFSFRLHWFIPVMIQLISSVLFMVVYWRVLSHYRLMYH